MRLLRNKLLIFNYIHAIFHILGSTGYITFMARMMEVQFNKSSQSGTILTGPITILGMCLGFLASGYIIRKFKPPPKYLFFWNVILGITSMSTQIYYTQIGCDGGNQLIINGTIASCNSNCNCDGISYTPVCDRLTNTTYFSPCHAGCKSFDKNENVYKECTCTTSTLSQIELYQSEIQHNQLLKKRSISTNNFYDKAFEYIQDEKFESAISNVDTFNQRHRRQINGERIITPQACSGDCSFDYYKFSFVSMCSSFVGASGGIGNLLLSFR